MRKFLDDHPKAVLFGEQLAMIVQRLALESAGPSAGFGVPVQIDEARLARMVIGAGTLVESASGPLREDGAVALADVIAFFVQSGAYSHSASPMGEIARYQQLLENVATELIAEGHDKASPIDQWMREDYPLSSFASASAWPPWLTSSRRAPPPAMWCACCPSTLRTCWSSSAGRRKPTRSSGSSLMGATTRGTSSWRGQRSRPHRLGGQALHAPPIRATR